MIKEELEKEAEEWVNQEYDNSYFADSNFGAKNDAKQAYLAGAEPREKQIQIDAEQIRALQKQNGELTDRVKELEAEVFFLKDSLNHEVELHQHAEEYIKSLEAQIEEMKCCGNCKHHTTFNDACMEYGYFLDKCDKTKWEIKEK